MKILGHFAVEINNKFSDFPVKQVLQASALASVSDQDVGKDVLRRLIECAGAQVDFGGFYTTCGWGSPTYYGMIDRRSGEMINMPDAPNGIATNAHNNLLVVNPDLRNIKKSDQNPVMRKYFVWTGSRFKEIDEDQRPTSDFKINEANGLE